MYNRKWKYSKFISNKNYKFDRNYILKYLPSNKMLEANKTISKWKGYTPTPLLSLDKLKNRLK